MQPAARDESRRPGESAPGRLDAVFIAGDGRPFGALLGRCPCGCGSPPIAIIGQGEYAREIHEHGATGECVAPTGDRNAPEGAGKSGASIRRRVEESASYMAVAPGDRAQTSRPGLFKRLWRLLDVIA